MPRASTKDGEIKPANKHCQQKGRLGTKGDGIESKNEKGVKQYSIPLFSLLTCMYISSSSKNNQDQAKDKRESIVTKNRKCLYAKSIAHKFLLLPIAYNRQTI